jgi:hypothetical protein
MSDKTVKSISVRANPELHKDLRVYAAEHDTSIDKVCLMAIEAWWAQQPEKALYAKRREYEKNLPIIPAKAIAEVEKSEQSAPKEGKAGSESTPIKGMAGGGSVNVKGKAFPPKDTTAKEEGSTPLAKAPKKGAAKK